MKRIYFASFFFFCFAYIIYAQEISHLKAGDFLFDGVGTPGAGKLATITDYQGKGGRISIDDNFPEYPDYDVTRIGKEAFRGKNITEVSHFPKELVAIGENAFADNMLTRITIPGAVTEISAGTFRNNRLTSLTLGTRVILIGEGAFQRNNLTNITLPNSVELVENNAFAGNSVTQIRLGANVELAPTAFNNEFAAYYKQNGMRAGTYVLRESRWYTEQAWKTIEDERKRQEEESRQQEEESVQQEAKPKSNTDFKIGFSLINDFEAYNGFKSNRLKARPFLSLDFGDSVSLYLSGALILPLDEDEGFQIPVIEADQSYIRFGSYRRNWLELGRIYFSDPVGYIVDGIFDGMTFSLSSLTGGVYYSGLIYKETAKITMDNNEFLDYDDDDIKFAPSRLIGSLEWYIGNYYNFNMVLAGLAQFDLRDTPKRLNSQYITGTFRFYSNSIFFDAGIAAGFLKTGEDASKFSLAFSVDLDYFIIDDIKVYMGLRWFSGAINETITPFVPISRYYSKPDRTSLWLPLLGFRYRINDLVSLDVEGRCYYLEGANFTEDSDWELDISLSFNSAYWSSLSGANPSSSGSRVRLQIPIFIGVYMQAWEPNNFSLGIPFQTGLEIDFGSFLSLALLGEAAAGLGYPYLLEGSAGGMAEVYVAGKRLGFGLGAGYYGNLVNWDVNKNDESKTTSSSYTRFALIFRNNNTKFSTYAQKQSDDKWGFGLQVTFNVL